MDVFLGLQQRLSVSVPLRLLSSRRVGLRLGLGLELRLGLGLGLELGLGLAH